MKPLKLTLPTAWTDLTEKQLLFVSRLWMAGYSEPEFLVKALVYLTGLRVIGNEARQTVEGAHWFTHRSIKQMFIIDAATIAAITDRCRYLLEPGEVNPLKRIGFARARHYRLYNATFEEYLMAENYFFAFTETKKPEHLDNLIACLYRKPWQRWDAVKIQRRAKAFKDVDPAIKNSVFMWYVGFRSYVPKRCKSLFSNKGKSSGRPFNPREYINGMVHQLSNGDITIKDKLLSRPCWDALDELEQRAIENELATR